MEIALFTGSPSLPLFSHLLRRKLALGTPRACFLLAFVEIPRIEEYCLLLPLPYHPILTGIS